MTTLVYTVSVVFSIRIPKKLKKLMDEYKDINWAEEVKEFISRRVRELLVESYLRAARDARRRLGRVEVPVSKLIREDREVEH